MCTNSQLEIYSRSLENKINDIIERNSLPSKLGGTLDVSYHVREQIKIPKFEADSLTSS